MAGIYIPERVLKMINEGGATEAKIDCIEIHIRAILEAATRIKDKDRKIKFYGDHFEELIQDLKDLGLIDY